MQQVINKVIHHYRITPTQLKSRDRHRTYREARQIIMWYLLTYTNLSGYMAGSAVNRDRTTAIHSRKVINSELEWNNEMVMKVERIFGLKLDK